MNLFKKYLLLFSAFCILLMCPTINSYAADFYDFETCRQVPFIIIRTSTFDQTYTFSLEDGSSISSQLISTSSIVGDGFSTYKKAYRITINEPGEYTMISTGSVSPVLGRYSVKVSNHDFSSEWTVDTEPTCTVDGSKSHHCAICDSKTGSEAIPATGHTANNDWKIAIQASCTTTGKKVIDCSTCGAVLKSETIPTTEHDFSSWKTSKKATIFKAGKQMRKCKTCSKTEYKTIPKLKSSVKLKKSQVALKAGSTVSLKIKSKSKGDVVSSWSTSDKKIVTVNRKTGKIKGIKKGTAYVTLKMKSGCTAKCKVKVK